MNNGRSPLGLYPFLRPLLALITGIVVGESRLVAIPMLYGGLLLAFCLLVLCLVYTVSDHYRTVWTGTLILLFFVVCGYLMASQAMQRTDYPFQRDETVCRVTVREVPEARPRSLYCPVTLHPDSANAAHTFLFYFAPDSAARTLCRGDELLVCVRLQRPVHSSFYYARFLRRRGITGTAYVPAGRWKRVGHTALESWEQRAGDARAGVVARYRSLGFAGDEAAVLAALTVGEKEELSADIKETYSATGASHVLALSGLHIGVIYGLLWWLFTPLWHRCRRLKPLLLVLIAVILAAFAFFTGASGSVVRSVVMFSVFAFASMQNERSISLNTLFATAFFMLLFRPLWLFDVGFQLSFAAVASIIFFFPLLHQMYTPRSAVVDKVWSLLCVSAVAQIGTAPLVMHYFHRFSTHFLLSSLWAIPLVTLILVGAMCLLVLTPFPALQMTFAPLLNVLLQGLNQGLRVIERFPWATVDGIEWGVHSVFLFYLCMAALVWCAHRPTARRCLVTLLLLLLLMATL